MSKQVDERVVSMQFDNKNFEKNVSTTMSTLDKLKQKLHFDGASKGLESINAASKKVDMNGLASGVEAVRVKFSALEVMGVTALANITNSAVNAGKKMVSALTIDPIKTGFQEYETQMNAVQTILANTQSKGSTIKDVNAALDELNKYADLTIYNFTEMTRNIGTFTAAGVDLDTSVSAIQGIANLAAVSGSTSQQASTAMYQLSQALAAGTVKLMDWNSVVNAGMGGEVFQNALKKTSEELNTGAEAAIKAEGSFRESLSTGWLTSEVLTKTLKKFTTSGANEYVAEYTGLSKKAVEASLKEAKAKYGEADAIKYASKALADKSGKNQKEIEEALTMAETATNAATKVKTFSQLWDVMKEAAQSGWAKTWQLIVGDFEEAKNLLTPLADFFTNIIGKISDARNTLLEGALGKRFTDLAKGISGIAEPVKSTATAVKSLGDVVDKVINGNFGNGEERFNALAKAGYNYCDVQNKVNEKLGSSFRYTEDQIKAQDKLLGTQTKATSAQKELTKSEAERIAKLTELSDAELKSIGYTEAQIKAIKEVKKEADKLGIPVKEFIENIDNLNGRSLVIESFKNIFEGLKAALTSVKDAWQNVFPPKSMEEKQQGLYDVIAAFHKFSEGVKKISEEADKEGSTVNKLRRTFEGLFTAVKMVSTIIGGPIKIAFKLLSKVLGMCDLDILDVTAAIGDGIVGFDKWIKKTFNFSKAFENIASGVKKVVKAIGEWFDSLKKSDNLPKDIADGIMSGLGVAWEAIKGFISNIGESISNGFNGVPGNLISGFANGIWNGIQVAGQVMAELGSQILAKFREVLGIHSPSTETQSDGENFILGFINGLKGFASQAWEAIKGFASECAELVGNINWGQIFASGLTVGLVVFAKKTGDALETLAAPFEGVGSVLSGVGKIVEEAAKPIKKILKNTAKVVKSFSKVLNGLAFDMKAEGIKKLATSVAILVGCIIALTFFKPEQLWESVKIIAALAGVLTLLAIVTEKMSKASVSIDKNGAKVNNIGKSLIGIAASLLLVAVAVKLIGSMNADQAQQGLSGLLAIIIGLGIVIGAYGALVKGRAAQNIDKAGGTILKIGAAILLLAVVAKIIGGMKPRELTQGVLAITIFGFIIAALIAATRLAGNKINLAGNAILKIGAAMLLLAMVVKIMGRMKPEQMLKGMTGISFLAVVIAGLIFATRLAGGNKLDKVGTTILAVSAAMLLLSMTAVIISSMSWESMGKAAVGIGFLAGIIAALITATRLAGGNDLKGVGTTLLMISVSIAILAGVAVVLGMIPIENLAKGIIAVGILGVIMALMIAATKNAKDCKGNLIVMTVAIAIMAAAVAALSFIEPSKLAGATAAMTILMGMFALMAKAAGSAQKSMGALIVMTVVVAALAGVIYMLSSLPIESTIGSAIALSALMLAMSGSLFVVSKIGGSATKALQGVLALTAMAVPLIAFVGVLAVASSVQNATQNAILLAALATVLTVLLIPLTVIGAFIEAALLGVLALTAMAVPLIAFVGVLAVMQCIGDATKNVLLLSTLMIVLTDCLVKVSLVAPLAVIGVAAIAALTGLMVAIGALAVGIGALMDTFPQLEEFLDTGIPIIEKLAYAVGSMVGNLVAGFSEALMSTLPTLGLCLSQFMINATPFIVGVKMVDQSVMDGVGTLSLAILALTAADLLAGVASFLQGGSTFADLGTELSQFILNATPFIVGAKTLDPKAMEGVKLLAETILLLTASDILDGLTSWLTGGSSFADFGEQLAPFGEGIAKFAKSVSGLDESSLTAMNSAAKAGKTLAEMASSLPNSGGLMGKIFGENDMDTFGTQLESFGKSLVKYGNSVVDLNVEAIDNSVPAAKSLSDLADNLPNTGGWVAAIFGDNDMETFGTQLEAFGKSLTNYGKSVAELKVDAINNSVPAAESLSKLADGLPTTGGIWSIFGDNDMETFGEHLESFGTSLKKYGESVTGLNVTCINGSVGAAEGISDMAKSLPDAAGWFETNDFTDFGSNMVSFAEKMKEYGEKVADLDTSSITTATTAFKEVADMAAGFSGIDFSGITSLSDSLGSIGSDSVDAFVTAYTDAYSKVTDAGSTMISKLVDGVNSKKASASSAFTTLISSCVGAIKLYYISFYGAGMYLGDGLAAGINAKETDAYNAGYALGQKAVEGEKDGQKSKSPSKLTIKAGKWLGEGLVIGMESFGNKVYKSGYELGDKSVKSISSAISKISDIIDSDMDSQPTIRPVVDLDDVYSGVNTMNSMLNLQPSVGVLSNVGSINRAMNRRNQNGGNDEVVSAINKLSKDLENVKGNTYNVNGITYDDGSNVSEAVSSLIRAARVERRV